MSNLIKLYYQDMSDLDLVLTIKEIRSLEPDGLIGDRLRNIAREVKEIVGGEGASLDLFNAMVSIFKEAAYRFEENSGFLTDDEFIDKYKPLMSDDGSNTLKEFESVEIYNLDRNYTWSWVEDGDKTYIIPGIRKVNRIAYYRTEVPHNGENIVVLWTDDNDLNK